MLGYDKGFPIFFSINSRIISIFYRSFFCHMTNKKRTGNFEIVLGSHMYDGK